MCIRGSPDAGGRRRVDAGRSLEIRRSAMPAHVLVAYASKHGSTREVAESIADTFRGHELDVDLQEAEAVEDVRAYDGVVLGGALYTGRLHSDARRFLRRHRAELARRPLAVYAMGPKTLG